MSDFDSFWAAYPNKKAKFDAMKAYAQALKLASPQEILDGVQRYIVGKPDYADWKLPAGWLRAGRWMDEYEDQPRQPRGVLTYSADFANWCQHEPKCNSRQWHAVLLEREKGETA